MILVFGFRFLFIFCLTSEKSESQKPKTKDQRPIYKMYYFLGISLLLAFLLALNAFISAAASLAWRVIEKPTQNYSARRRTQIIFALRVLPFLFAVIFVFGFFAPAYFLFEPHTPKETVTAKIGFLAVLSIIGILAASLRVFGTWWRTHRLVKSWLERSEIVFVENVSLPVYRIRHPFPVIAVVGTFQTKMFIAEQVFSSLNERELAAAVNHECGHLAARDNLKRTLLRICRDLLVFPLGKTLDKAWAENAEAAADEYAAAKGGNPSALSLAAALVKIARIAPKNAAPAMPLSASLIGDQTADITWRVRRLVDLAETESSNEKHSFLNFKYAYGIMFFVVSLLILFLATNHSFLYKIHIILENIVHILQ